MNKDIVNLFDAALECSVFVQPLDPGLSPDELMEVGRRAGYYDGELEDALARVGESWGGSNRLITSAHDRNFWQFFFTEEPEYRNFAAFDFVVAELNLLARLLGAANAAIERDVLVEQAVSSGIPRHDVEVAITWQQMSHFLSSQDQLIRFSDKGGARQLPSETRKLHGQVHRKPARLRAYSIVKDVISRRDDGRLAHAEPLDAFADVLAKLGHSNFRLWWIQTVAELRRAGGNVAPVSITVLAAAIVEGALTFLVNYARARAHFQSSDYDRSPRHWRIDKLIGSAASGAEAVLDPQTKLRAEALIKVRQRIHAGRMMEDYPGGPPDLRPDEARDAKNTADLVVRAVLDWLESHP